MTDDTKRGVQRLHGQIIEMGAPLPDVSRITRTLRAHFNQEAHSFSSGRILTAEKYLTPSEVIKSGFESTDAALAFAVALCRIHDADYQLDDHYDNPTEEDAEMSSAILNYFDTLSKGGRAFLSMPPDYNSMMAGSIAFASVVLDDCEFLLYYSDIEMVEPPNGSFIACLVPANNPELQRELMKLIVTTGLGVIEVYALFSETNNDVPDLISAGEFRALMWRSLNDRHGWDWVHYDAMESPDFPHDANADRTKMLSSPELRWKLLNFHLSKYYTESGRPVMFSAEDPIPEELTLP